MPHARTLHGLAAATVVLFLTACTGSSSSGQGRSSPSATLAGPAPTSTPCAAAVTTGALPAWARAGFDPATQPVPYVTGADGDIVGVLFGQPLSAPRSPGRANKILWVSRVPVAAGSTLSIHATLRGSGLTVDRQVAGGPGPSLVDLPRAGCWAFDLAWSGHTDHLSVPYTQPVDAQSLRGAVSAS